MRLSITLGRQEQVDFSNMTWVDGAGLLVRAGQGLGNLSDMGGKRIAVIPGTTTEKALSDTLRKRTVSAQIVPVKDHDEGRDDGDEKAVRTGAMSPPSSCWPTSSSPTSPTA